MPPFHLAIRVRNVAEAREFYGHKLGFAEGRSAATWIDFNMFGHQLVTHLDESIGSNGQIHSLRNPVDLHDVPVPHFGVVLSVAQWQTLRTRVSDFVSQFIVPPHVRFAGQAGEQWTMFFTYPTVHALEFKSFADPAQLFAVDQPL